MENKENNCCEKIKKCCSENKPSHCCMMKKYHMLKILGLLVIIAIAFCFGSFFGRTHLYNRNYSHFGNNTNMMDSDEYQTPKNNMRTTTGEVRVNVVKTK